MSTSLQRNELTFQVTDELGPADLYRRHSQDLRRLLLALLRDPTDAEDALQQVFLKLLDEWSSIRTETAKSWLFTVAYREAMTARRRKHSDAKAMAKIWSQPVWLRHAGEPTPTETAVQAEEYAAVRRALDELPANQREIVQGRVYDGKTFATLAKECNAPLGTVLTRMRLALKKLRTLIEG
jgi:RNA polymerase sigma factor (sigma-70 family)